MLVVLLAMGGYGSYLGWQIRLSDDAAVVQKAEDLHPKLAAGMVGAAGLSCFVAFLHLRCRDSCILHELAWWVQGGLSRSCACVAGQLHPETAGHCTRNTYIAHTVPARLLLKWAARVAAAPACLAALLGCPCPKQHSGRQARWRHALSLS